jgi:hypothetical protein
MLSIAITLTLFGLLAIRAAAAHPRPHKTHARHGHTFGYLLAAKLNRGLLGTPMAGTGFALVDESKPYGLNPALIAGIAGTESTFGEAPCSNNRYNAFGLANCGGAWTVPAFGSWRQAYRFMAGFLTSRWPSAQTPYDYTGYAADPASWGGKTSAHMADLGFPATVRIHYG